MVNETSHKKDSCSNCIHLNLMDGGGNNNCKKGVDLYYLIMILQSEEITVINLDTKSLLYEGIAINYNCERVKYEVIKFEKLLYNNTYEIIVKKI